MRWIVHGERELYASEWLRLTMVDVEIPGEPRFGHHVVRMPSPAVGVVAHDPDLGVLLLWRHRFITDTWGWEVPAGRVDPGEDLEEAAARETREETGWRPGPLRELARWHPTNGLSDQLFVAYVADGARHEGPPTDPGELERVAWVPDRDLPGLLRAGEVTDGLSLTALALFLAGVASGP